MNTRTDSDIPATATRQAGGFTIHEVILVTSMLAVLMTSISSLFTTNSNLARGTRTHQMAEAAHRKNHAALARVLRGIDIQSLAGFGSDGVATSVTFRRVTGADLGDLTHRGDERLQWISSPVAVNGVPSPGAVYLVRDGKNYLVADRVPRGGFQLEQAGQSVIVTLTTYYATTANNVATKTSESAISIRN